jgi:hypothetical protein
MQHEDKEKAEAEEFLKPVREIKAKCAAQHEVMKQQEKDYARVFQMFINNHHALPLEMRRRYLFRAEDAVNESTARLAKIDSLLNREMENLRGMEECTAAIPPRYRGPCRELIGECCRLNLAVKAIIGNIQTAADETVNKLQTA